MHCEPVLLAPVRTKRGAGQSGDHDGLRFSLFDDHLWPTRLVLFMFRFSQLWPGRVRGVGRRGLKVTSVLLDSAPFECLFVFLSFFPQNEMSTFCCRCALGPERPGLCQAEVLRVVSNLSSEERLPVAHQRRLVTSAAGFAARPGLRRGGPLLSLDR